MPAADTPFVPYAYTYQDVWIKGELKQRGERECASRFEIIKQFCAQYTRPFTVLDFGANSGYFTIRLTELFNCTVVAIEGDWSAMLCEILGANDSRRVVVLNQMFDLPQLRMLARVEHFDLVLAMSVIHHVRGGPMVDIFEALRDLGDHLIVELPVEDNFIPRGNDLQAATALRMPPEARFIGVGLSHMQQKLRPVYHVPRAKISLRRDAGFAKPHVAINADFAKKIVRVGQAPPRPWVPGISLKTYCRFHGAYPAPAQVNAAVHAACDAALSGPRPLPSFVISGHGVCTVGDPKWIVPTVAE